MRWVIIRPNRKVDLEKGLLVLSQKGNHLTWRLGGFGNEGQVFFW